MKVLTTIFLSVMATSTFADTSLTFTNKKDNVAMKMQIAGNKMRATSVGDNSSYMIYDAANTTFTMVDTKRKSYFVMDKEAIASLSDIGAMMDRMLEKQLADMPAEQRQMMRGMLEGALKSQMPKEMPKAEYKLTGKTKSYNGFDCQVVKKKLKRKKSEFCVTDYSAIGMSKDEYSVIESFQGVISNMAQQFGADKSMDFSELGNFIPVNYNQAGEQGTLSDVSHESLGSSLFVMPSGYERQEMPL